MSLSGTEVAVTATPTSRKDLLAAIAHAIKARTQRQPSRKQLSLVWAQWALETGRGKSCWNYNIGNIRGTSPESKKYILLPGAYEIIDGKRVVTGGSFRAYDTLDEGARDYVSVLFGGLAGGDHGWRALTSTENPDATSFVKGLKDDKYFTADVTEYSKSVDSLSRECMTKTAEGDWPVGGDEEHTPAPGDWHDWNALADKSRRYESPCKGNRPSSITKPTHIVIHITGTTSFSSVKNRFMTAGQASSHYLVDQEGHIHQFVTDAGRAWHAGISAAQLALYKKNDGSWRKYKRYFDWSKYPGGKFYDGECKPVTDQAKAILVGTSDGSEWPDYEYFKKRWGALNQPFNFDKNIDPNNYSIGIELLSVGAPTANATDYPEALYDGLDALLTDLCKKYGIPRDRQHIIGHEDVDPCARWGWDPNQGFDWDRVLSDGDDDDEPQPKITFSEPATHFDLSILDDEGLYDHLRDAWIRAQKRFGNEGKADYNFQDENGRMNLIAARGFDCGTMKPVPSTNTKYDDTMFLVYKTKDGTKKVSKFYCTTEWTRTPTKKNPKKADAIILLGQHKYQLANHATSRYSVHVSLKDVKAAGDLSKKNYRALRPDPTVKITRQGDAEKVGSVGETASSTEDNGSINIHYGGEHIVVPNGGSGGWSDGCQVLAKYEKFLEFMKLVESDASIKGTSANELSEKPAKNGTRSIIYTLVEGSFLAPPQASSAVTFPIVGKDAEAHYALNENGEGGFFPIGTNNFWHGGVHLDAGRDAIQAISDGDIVAYRITKKALEVKLGDELMHYSNSFVLIRHERFTPKGAKLELFSLAIHLLPWDEYSDTQKKKPPVFLKKLETVTFDKVVSCKIPVSTGAILGYPGVFFTRPATVHFEVLTGDVEFMKNPKGDKGGTEVLHIPAGTKLKKRATVTPPEVKVDMTAGSLVCLLEQPPGDARKVQCTDLVGWTKRASLGAYDKASGTYGLNADLATLTSEPGGGETLTIDAKKGGKVYYVAEKGETDRQVRFTFPLAEQTKRVGWAMRDALGDWNAGLKRYKLKDPLPVLYQEKPDLGFSFEEEAGTAAEEIFTDVPPLSDPRVCKDKEGNVWQEVDFGSGKGWVQRDKETKVLSPYDWPHWLRIEEVGKYSEDGLCDAQNLLSLLDSNADGEITQDEIKAALKVPATAQKLRRIACLHPTEWAGEIPGLSRLLGPPWRMQDDWLKATTDYIKALGFWADAASAGLPPKDKVWHLHPIGVIEQWRALLLLKAPAAEKQPPEEEKDEPEDTPEEKKDKKEDKSETKDKEEKPQKFSELILLCEHSFDSHQRAAKGKDRFEVVPDVSKGKDHLTLLHRDSEIPSPAKIVVNGGGAKTNVSAVKQESGHAQYEFDAPFKGAQLHNILEGTFWKNLTQPTEYKIEGLPKPLTVASYRPNKWKLSIKLPPMRGYKAGAKLESETKVVAGPGATGVATRKKATLEKEITGWKKTTKLEQTSTTSTAVIATASQVLAAQQKSATSTLTQEKSKSAVELSCDGKLLTDEVGTLNTILGIVAIASQVIEVLAAIQDKVPQVGWYAEASIQLLQGTFNLEVQMKEYTDHRTYLGIKAGIDVVLFSISLEVGVGVSGCGFKAQVFAKIEGSLTLSLSVERISPSGAASLQVPLVLAIQGSVGARFEAGNWVKIEGAFETALELSATFELHMEKGASIAGSMKWTGLSGKVSASVGPGGAMGSYSSKQTFVDEKDLGSFKWPDKPYAPVYTSRSTIKSIITDTITDGWDVRVVAPSGKMFVADDEWSADKIAEKLTAKVDSRKDIRRDMKSMEGLAHDIRQRLNALGKRDWSLDWIDAKDFEKFVNNELDKIITASYLDPCKELMDRCK